MPDQALSAKTPAESHTLAQRILFACIRGYQLVLSPAFGRQCRYYPSCSHYALEAIARHGAGRGMLLSAGRIARCNPLCEGGHDPVPQRFPKK